MFPIGNLIDDRVALPAPGQPTTHILKPAIALFPHTTENEALVLAAAVGLPVAPVAARTVGGRPYLLVTRYDRRFGASGRAHRLHQEDFCQALGIPPERKYAAEGGPTFKTGFDLLRRATTVPAGAVLAFLDAGIFNLIVGNADDVARVCRGHRLAGRICSTASEGTLRRRDRAKWLRSPTVRQWPLWTLRR